MRTKDPSSKAADPPKKPDKRDLHIQELEQVIRELRESLNESIYRTQSAEAQNEKDPFPFLSVDHDWRILKANPAACTLWSKKRMSFSVQTSGLF